MTNINIKAFFEITNTWKIDTDRWYTEHSIDWSKYF